MFAKSEICPECESPVASDGLCEVCDVEERCPDCAITLCPDGSCPCCEFEDIFDEDVSSEELDEILARLESL